MYLSNFKVNIGHITLCMGRSMQVLTPYVCYLIHHTTELPGTSALTNKVKCDI